MKKLIIWIVITFLLLLVASISLYILSITVKLEINEYEIEENFKDIKIITDTADINFVISENLNTLIICEEQKNVNHSVIVNENTLLIEVDDNRKWYEYLGINFSTPKITLYLPKSEYGELLIQSNTGDINIPTKFKFKNIEILEDTGNITNYALVDEIIKIKTSTGNIYIENINADMIDLSTSTGKVNVKNVNCSEDVKINVSTGNTKIIDTKCKNLISKGSTGDISLENVIATEKFSIETNTGDVKLKASDASNIFIKTDTGNVTGSLLTEKVIFAESDTGKIDIPKVIADEKCEIITDTGNIKITIE